MLGGRDLATGRACVAQIHDVEAMLASRDGRPGERWPAGHPPLDDGVAVGDPPRLWRRRSDVAADAGQLGDHRPHAFGEVDDHPVVVAAIADVQPGDAVAQRSRLLVDVLACPPGAEGRAGPGTPVSEITGGGHVADLDGGCAADQLEADADRQRRYGSDVRRQPRIGQVGARIAHAGGLRPGRSPDVRFDGFWPQHGQGALISNGNLTLAPPSTTSV